MNEIRYTLIADGTSDKRMIPILTWLLQENCSKAIAATFADLAIVGSTPRSLEAKVRAAMELYPADLLFVHRDAENASREQRLGEIEIASRDYPRHPIVPVVPIRMHEAWLLISERAIREAAGNPNGTMSLSLPLKKTLEGHPDPKTALYNALRTASGLTGRHLNRFKVQPAAYRVSELIGDYSVLRGLSAFDALEADLVHSLRAHELC